jgi:MFS family permease
MPDEFGLCYRGNDCSARELWTFGMLNAVPLLSAGLFGTILADPLQENVLGRRGSVMLSCAITLASTIGASVTQNVSQLAICRAINGIALGAKASISESKRVVLDIATVLTPTSSDLLCGGEVTPKLWVNTYSYLV